MAFIRIQITGFNGYIESHPPICPCCNAHIDPLPLFAHTRDEHSNQLPLQIAYRCTKSSCRRLFIGLFEHGPMQNGHHVLYCKEAVPKQAYARLFKEHVTAISRNFCDIYNEAYAAEQYGLMQICGVGYRKAIEFLIKDYLIHNDPDKREQYEKTLLGPCIENHIKNDNIKTVAKRATWLGNDETHYVRKWSDKDLKDLQKLIDLTVYWIEHEELTRKALEDMPESGKKKVET